MRTIFEIRSTWRGVEKSVKDDRYPSLDHLHRHSTTPVPQACLFLANTPGFDPKVVEQELADLNVTDYTVLGQYAYDDESNDFRVIRTFRGVILQFQSSSNLMLATLKYSNENNRAL